MSKDNKILTEGVLLALLLFFTTFFMRMTGNMVQTTVPLYAQYYLGMNTAEIGVVSAAFMLASVVTPLLVVTRIGIGKLNAALFLFGTSFAITIPLYYFVSGSIGFYALIVATSMLSSTVMPLLLTSSQTTQKGTVQRNIGLYTVALSSSLVFGPFFEAIVAGHYGEVKIVFLFFFPFSAAAALMLLLKYRRYGAGQVTDREGSASILGKSGKGGTPGMRHLITSPRFLVPTIGQVSYSLVFAAVLAFGALLAERRMNAGLGAVFYLFSAFFATSWGTRVMITLLPDIRKKVRLLHLSSLLSLTGLILVFASHGALLLYTTFAVLGIPHGLQYPVSSMLIAEGVEREDLPAANALFFSTGAGAMAITPLAVGFASIYIGLGSSVALLALPVALLWLLLYKIAGRSGKSNEGGDGGFGEIIGLK